MKREERERAWLADVYGPSERRGLGRKVRYISTVYHCLATRLYQERT